MAHEPNHVPEELMRKNQLDNSVTEYRGAQSAAHLPSLLSEPKKLGMWLFIAADGTVFLTILAAYAYLRLAGGRWPQVLTWGRGGADAAVMTACLLAGSVALSYASRRIRAGSFPAAARWTAVAAVLGLIFAFLQWELWTTMEGKGVGLTHDLRGTSLFGSFFFVLTGLNLVHVAAGSLAAGITAVSIARRSAGADAIETTALYWKFLGAAWLAIFAIVVLPSTHGI